MPPVGFEPTISAGERPQNYALDRAATGTGYICMCSNVYFLLKLLLGYWSDGSRRGERALSVYEVDTYFFRQI